MNLDQSEILASIDEVIDRVEHVEGRTPRSSFSSVPEDLLFELLTLMSSTIERFAPPGSQYRSRMNAALPDRHLHGDIFYVVKPLLGILRALRTAYEKDHLRTVQELIHADVFSDFLEMAGYLLDGGYKDPAAVLAGGVLEVHLRKLCVRHVLPTHDATKDTTPRPTGAINDDLAKVGAYTRMQQDSIKAWLKLGNSAAHSHYGDYDKRQVEVFIMWLRDFVSRYPA